VTRNIAAARAGVVTAVGREAHGTRVRDRVDQEQHRHADREPHHVHSTIVHGEVSLWSVSSLLSNRA
jgi:hypothetical protein